MTAVGPQYLTPPTITTVGSKYLTPPTVKPTTLPVYTDTKQITPIRPKYVTPPTAKPKSPCQKARNLTESWRTDIGSKIKPGGPFSKDQYACDFHFSSAYWFRFMGAAGNRMLNKCPNKKYSCGTLNAYWTDDEMPQQIEVETLVNAYEATYVKLLGLISSRKCQYRSVQLKVMRCSPAPNDFIYKLTSYVEETCTKAFCGMM